MLAPLQNEWTLAYDDSAVFENRGFAFKVVDVLAGNRVAHGLSTFLNSLEKLPDWGAILSLPNYHHFIYYGSQN